VTALVFPVAAQWVIAQGLTQRPVVAPFLNNTFPKSIQGSTSGWTVVQAFPNLTFDDPVYFGAEPRTNRLYVCERQGRIYHFVNDPATTSKTLFLDRTPVTQGYDDCGMMGIAFHPEYGIPGSANRGYVYVYYQFSESPTSGPGRPPSATPGFNRLSRFTVPDGSLVADPASELVLINQFDRHVWHNGGAMLFGPDGFLYVSNGDEGAANDSYNQSQEINSGLFSGVLRIDVDQDPSRSHPTRRQPQSDTSPPGGWTNVTFSANYYIPNDNPWLDPGGSILEEFYAVGLRSPHRMTFDPATGRIWLGDIGQGAREEVDLIEKGGNYQWAYREGNNNGPKAKPNPIIGVDKPPVYDYGRGAGDTCVIGGYVYRGSLHPSLYGKYIFGDNTSGRVWAMTYDGINPTTVVELLDTGWPNNYQGLSSFGLDNHHELYLCNLGRPSQIYKLAPSGPPPPEPPALLSQTGAFTNLATLAAAPALIPYDVNSPLWSDAAEKKRWLIVPNDGAPYDASETIGFATNGSWSWPTGTVFVKHFALRTNETDPASLKPLETRFLVKGTNTGGWYGVTYKWRSDQSDADLLSGAAEDIIMVTTPSGVRTQLWSFPGRGDCLTCHNANADHVLGLRTCQMNREITYPQTGLLDNQINALNAVGFFNPVLNPASIPSLPRTVAIGDTNATLETRVRSYLDSNCAHCHRPDGVSALFDARFDTPLGSQGIIDGAVVNPMGIDGARILKPGSLNQSLLYVRDSLVGLGQMPPLARNMAHQEYVDTLAQWINSFPPPPPGNPNATALSASSIAVEWEDPSASELGFVVERSYDGAVFVPIVTNAPNQTNYLDQGLRSATAHYYRIWASYTAPTSAVSSVVVATTFAGGAAAFQQDPGADGLVVMEAEGFDANISNSGINWSTNLTAGYSGTAALQALPNSGINQDTGYAASSPRLDFEAEFVHTGTHYVWIRGIGLTGSDDSCHAGLDGVEISTSDRISSFGTGWTWSKTTMDGNADATLPVATSGVHTINIWMREDGFIIDKLLLTTNPSYAPTGAGPAQSPRTGAASPPSISEIANQVIDEDTSAGPLAFTVNDDQTFPENLLVAVESSNTNLIQPANLVLSGAGSNRSLTVTPGPNMAGASIITVTASDGFAATNNTFEVTVLPVNDAPVAVGDILVRWPNQGAKVEAGVLLNNDTDVEGDPITLVSAGPTSAAGGAVSQVGGWVHYQPPGGYYSNDSFLYRISDGQGGTNDGTVSVQLSTESAPSENLQVSDLGDGTIRIRGWGVPLRIYQIQYSDSQPGPVWQMLTNVQADALGAFEHLDLPPTNSPPREYRTVEPGNP